MRGFYPIERSTLQNHASRLLGKTVDVEIKRIVVTVGDLRIDRGKALQVIHRSARSLAITWGS